jgi:hypothetical protein
MPSSLATRSMLGALIAGLTFGLTELGLRLWGGVAGDRVESPLAYQSLELVEATVQQPLSRASDLQRWGRWRRATPVEAPGLRVVVLGGSTAEGDRIGPFHAFAAQIERALSAATDRPVEVINAGQGGIANRHVALKLEQLLRQGPVDLVVVYSGDNEFLEILGLKMTVPGWSARVELTRRRLWGLHIYRALARGVIPSLNRGAAPPGAAHRAQRLEGSIEPDERALVELLHREALVEMAARARAAGVPLLLSTVADNLLHKANLDGRPTARPPVGPGEQARWDAWTALPPDRLRARLADEAALTGPDWFALGEVLLARGDRANGVKALLHAERLDPRPHRSNHRMRADLLEVAAAHGAAACDVAGSFQAGGHIGGDVFYDACHPTAAGHTLIAQTLLRCIEEQGLLPVTGAAGRPIPPPPDPLALDGRSDPRLERDPAQSDDGSWEGALRAGHQALLHMRPAEAVRWVDTAAARGAPERTVLRSRLMAQITGDESIQRADQLAADLDALGDAALSARWGR